MATPFQHLVVLMLENRSFDHMLGFLKSPGYNIEGLDGTETNPGANPGDPAVLVSRDARTVHDLNPDPGHGFVDVNVQIFGNPAGQTNGPLMQGFVQNYAHVSNQAAHGANIMKCFTPATLPVLNTLAREYAVCDHWFSSVPGSTIPNRLFAHGATSMGSLTQDVALAPSKLKTIFEMMDDPASEETYRIYTDGASVLLANLYLAHHQGGFHPYSDFRTDCINGDLPAYTFIEPSYDDDTANGRHARSQHPDFPVDEGEGLIAEVYNALRDSPVWEDSLLLIVYDEHGGIYDHVPPPTLTPDPAHPAVEPSKDPAFAFDRLGVRVPAVMVSPFIERGTIITRQFEHSSIPATVRKMFCVDRTPFNWREAQAATFDDVLTRTVARPERLQLPNPVTSPPLTGAAATRIPPATKKPTDLSILMAQAMQYSMDTMGLKAPMRVNDIYTAQDATNYLRQASDLIKGKHK